MADFQKKNVEGFWNCLTALHEKLHPSPVLEESGKASGLEPVLQGQSLGLNISSAIY